MNKNLPLLTLLFILALLSVPREGVAQIGGPNGNFGLGLIVGEPVGVSAKYWMSSRSAYSFGVAWSTSDRDEALYLHADYAIHSWMQDVERGRLGFYYGLGGRFLVEDDPHIGIRVPLGLNYMIDRTPLDLFFEAVPVLDIIPDTDLKINGGLGIRYYF